MHSAAGAGCLEGAHAFMPHSGHDTGGSVVPESKRGRTLSGFLASASRVAVWPGHGDVQFHLSNLDEITDFDPGGRATVT